MLFSNQMNFSKDLTRFSELLIDTIGGISCTSLGADKMEKWGGGTKYTNSYGRFIEINSCFNKKIVFWVGLGIKNTRDIYFVIQFRPLSISCKQSKKIEKPLDPNEFNNFRKSEDISILQNFIIENIVENVEKFREDK